MQYIRPCNDWTSFIDISLFLGADVAPPGEGSLVPHEPIIFKLFDKFKDAPLIGLEYLVEIIHGPNVDPTYENLLTKNTLNAKDVISDVVSAKHRLKYLVSSLSYFLPRACLAQGPISYFFHRSLMENDLIVLATSTDGS